MTPGSSVRNDLTVSAVDCQSAVDLRGGRFGGMRRLTVYATVFFIISQSSMLGSKE
jgi:hypothetical protein